MNKNADVQFKPLREILRAAINGLPVNGWLYLPKNPKSWNLETHGIVLDADQLDDWEEGADKPRIAIELDLIEGLDSATIDEIARGSFRFGVEVTDELLFEGFMYYYRHDAWLPEPGAYDPNKKVLPYEERLLEMERRIYDEYGEERQDQKCKNQLCSRGALPLRIFCRIHHYEMMQKKPCPFTN